MKYILLLLFPLLFMSCGEKGSTRNDSVEERVNVVYVGKKTYRKRGYFYFVEVGTNIPHTVIKRKKRDINLELGDTVRGTITNFGGLSDLPVEFSRIQSNEDGILNGYKQYF